MKNVGWREEGVGDQLDAGGERVEQHVDEGGHEGRPQLPQQPFPPPGRRAKFNAYCASKIEET